MFKKIFKFFYFLFFALLASIALFLIISVLPVNKGAYHTMIVQSGSMEPEIRTGSIVIVKSVGDYQVGDIITFGENSKKKRSVTHRIVEIKEEKSGKEFVTKGDANNAPDQKTAQESKVIGKVLFSIPYIGYAVSAAQKPVGFVLIVVIPAIIIIYDEINKIKKEVKKKIDHRKMAKMEKEKKEQEKRQPQITIKRTENLVRTMEDIQKKPDVKKRKIV